MNKKVTKLVLCFALFSTILYSQDKDSLFVHLNLEIKHSKKIPYNSFKVKFDSFKNGNVKVKVQSKPLYEKLKKWKYSVIDTTFYINRKVYKQINDSILKIENKVIVKNLQDQSFPSIDGYKCKLEFGAFSNKISYSLENPSPQGVILIVALMTKLIKKQKLCRKK